MTEIAFFDTRAAFAMRVGQLSSLLYDQMESCLVSSGLRLRGYTTSIVQTLHHAGPQSITELAERLQLSHQLASQRVRWLVGEGFVTIDRGAEDRRRSIVTLTSDGSAEAEKLQGFLPVLQSAYADLFDEIGLDVHRAVLDATAALADRPLAVRGATPD
jgi:DNA-binding MarR family transcriptional regulator